MFPVRQPDTDTYRFWEIAGGAHGGDGLMNELQPILLRDEVVLGGGLDVVNRTANTLDWSYVRDAALRALVQWARHGTPPPAFERIEMTYGDPLTSIRRDQLGLARGGLRHPEVDVPVAAQLGVNSTPDMLLKLSGERRPFAAEELRSLYSGADDYLRRYGAAADEAAARGVVLADDLAELVAHGRELSTDVGLT